MMRCDIQIKSNIYRRHCVLWEDGVVVEEQLGARVDLVDLLEHLHGNVGVAGVRLVELSVQVLVVHVPVDESNTEHVQHAM
jgi:hypothetical protein